MLLPRAHGHRRRRSDAVRAGIGAAGVGATALLAARGGVSEIEREVFEAINGLPQTASPGLWVVMQAGSFPAVFVAAGLALVARRPRLAIALAAGGTATWLLAKAVKQVVDRGRPEAVLHDVVIYGPAATGLGLSVRPRRRGGAAHDRGLALPDAARREWSDGPSSVLVAFTRVLIGAHLPLDALGGLLLGWTVGSATNWLLGTPGTRTSPERSSPD